MMGEAIPVIANVLKDETFRSTISNYSDKLKYWAEAQVAKKEANDYREKARTATECIEVFKNLLLAENKALEGYIAQTRAQADDSFQLSKKVAIAGFILIFIGIALG